MKINISIHSELKGTRLDTVISEFDQDCSRSRAVWLINNSHILVNTLNKKPGYRVKRGDIITGEIPQTGFEPVVSPEDIELNVIFEDDHSSSHR